MAEDSPIPPLQHSASVPLSDSTSQLHGISINFPTSAGNDRPPMIKHVSNPSYPSPLRHHQRTPSRSKGVKETLNARSHYGSSDDGDGPSVHRINQYIIKQEIGRGSYGSVHLAEDQYGNEFAVKEFSKSRLRKRAQSNLLRKPNQSRRPGQISAGLGFNSPLHRLSSAKSISEEDNNSLNLIKEEIAIMKKLDHNNLVSLIEVLDDPQEDSLYMVLEMCKKGVAMKVGLEERADPYDDETCRCWFRDMILGIEYLHAQGIIHRDIKPDNCLITSDDVLKIVDFGVSEMFERASEMATAKSAGSPAFMPPELCVAKHGQVSGRAADIWSMGVTLYCLRYGRIPFEKENLLELYESIRADDVPVNEEPDAKFADLMRRVLDKDPETRITMGELRNHPWITKDDTDPLLSAEENCADIIDPPTEAEMDNAITGNMAHLMAVMSAVKRFKDLIPGKRGRSTEGFFGKGSTLTAPPQSIQSQARSQDTHDRKPVDGPLATEGIHRDVDVDDGLAKLPHNLNKVDIHRDEHLPELVTYHSGLERHPGETGAHYKQRMEALRHHQSSGQHPGDHRKPFGGQRAHTFPLAMEHAKGQAHDPLEDRFFLNIGHDPDTTEQDDDQDYQVVSESPPAVEMDIYEQAYKDEMERIMAKRGREPSAYLTRRVDHRDDIRALSNVKDAGKFAAKHAAATFDDVVTQSYSTGAGMSQAGRDAARVAAGEFSNRLIPANASAGQGADSWAELFKSAASGALDTSRAATKNATSAVGDLYNTYTKSDTVRGGLANVVAQAKSGAEGQNADIVSSPTDVGDAYSSPFESKGTGVVQSDAEKAAERPKSSGKSKASLASVLALGAGTKKASS